VINALKLYMARKSGLGESEKQRDRARRCRELADGAGDPDFAAKLYALSEEYEGLAKHPVRWSKDRSRNS